MIHVFETGDPFLNVSGCEFRDPDRSYLILIKSQTTIIGRTYNLVSGKREDFEVKDIDKKKFLSYLKMANA